MWTEIPKTGKGKKKVRRQLNHFALFDVPHRQFHIYLSASGTGQARKQRSFHQQDVPERRQRDSCSAEPHVSF